MRRGIRWRSLRRSLIPLALILMILSAAWPVSNAHAAARVNRFTINTGEADYLIAGRQYGAFYESDKASSTLAFTRYDYSTNNGAIWHPVPYADAKAGVYYFRMPIDPQLTSAVFRVGVDFIPVIGSDSYSEKIIGPYPILQPGAPSNVTAKANNDGSVTLEWDDNSNMEKTYWITRYGPDGTKTFSVGNTTAHVGPTVYTDKKTNANKETIYVYALSMEFDEKYALTEEESPGIVHVAVKTKVPIKLSDQIRVTDTIVIKPTPKLNLFEVSAHLSEIKLNDQEQKFVDTRVITQFGQDLWGQLNKDGKTLPAVAVSGAQLSAKSVSLQPGASVGLTASAVPSDATNKKIEWSSSDAQVANVSSSGQVTGVSPGTAKITAKTSEGGFTAVCIVTVSSPEPAIKDVMKITDVDGHKLEKEIAEAVDLGIVKGYPDGTFQPEANITRAEFTSMLVKGLKPSGEGAALTFKDKGEIGNWAMPSVGLAVKLGFITGYKDNTFRPNANITHAEMISMVIRASGLAMNDAPKATGYADDADIPGWAKPAVSTAQETGIIIVGGISDKFAPQALSTRAEAASAVVRMLKVKS